MRRTPGSERRNLEAMPRVPKVEPTATATAAALKPAAAKAPGAPDDRELVRRREDVEDIAQQVFVKAYFSLKRFDQRAAFSTWLYKITVNECWDLLRKKKVRPLLYESDLSEEQAQQFGAAERVASDAQDISDKLEAQQRVERLLQGLDP